MAKDLIWHVVGPLNAIEWQANGMAIVEVGGKKITLGKHQDAIYAFAHKCPHASGIMADGFINAVGRVVCPLHRYQFSLENGRNTSGEGYFLKTYPVKMEEDQLWVGVKRGGFFGIVG
jgi:3-phenylpropionate/trans-cinnamate dioxygenase ferredoxin subunit